MNKKLIALAIAGATVAPAAMAQTANPVTLYGRVYATFESVEAKGGSGAAVSRRSRIEDQSSLLGVRGTEDLGGGLKAFFQLETAFRPDQNNTTFAARNSAVGLQGGFGSILIGRWDSPYKTATIAVDPYGDLTISGITGVLNDRGNFDRRQQNTAQYWSPNFAGFAFRLMGTANETKAAVAGTNPRDYGANVTYNLAGGLPVYAFVAWEQHKDNNNAAALAAGGAGATSSYKEEGTAVGATIAPLPLLKIGGQYQEYKKSNRTKQKAAMANAVLTFGNHQIIGQYMKSKDGKLSASATAEEPDCDSWSGAYQYNFSRRTFFIASYVQVDNNNAASCNFGSNVLTATAGQDPKGAFVGIRHVF